MTSKSFERLKHKARLLKTDLYALYLAYKDPRVPKYARILALCIVGYVFSPIDLIPDPIPVIGYLDALILIPSGMIEAYEVFLFAQEVGTYGPVFVKRLKTLIGEIEQIV